MQIQISWLLRSQLIWICTVCKGRVYPGSAGQGLRNGSLSYLIAKTCWCSLLRISASHFLLEFSNIWLRKTLDYNFLHITHFSLETCKRASGHYLQKGKWPLWKHAYSNILKILPPKNENFQIKNSGILHISAQNRLWILVRTASMIRFWWVPTIYVFEQK